jgi:type VI secretion system protein VasG
MSANLRSLIAKLNETGRSALETAAGLCLARTHYDVEVEHFLLKALDSRDRDVSRNLQYFKIDQSRLTSELTRSVDKLKSGNARTPTLSPRWSRC